MRAVSALLVLSACSGVPATSTATADAALSDVVVGDVASDAQDTTPPPRRPHTEVVVVAPGSFIPQAVGVHVGDSIEFRWGTTFHRAIESGFACLDDGMFYTPAFIEPQTWVVRMLRSGPYPYFVADDCTIVGVIAVSP